MLYTLYRIVKPEDWMGEFEDELVGRACVMKKCDDDGMSYYTIIEGMFQGEDYFLEDESLIPLS